MHNNYYKYPFVALTLFGMLALVAPISAQPSSSPIWSPTGENCSHPSDPGNIESGIEYVNSVTGMTSCFKDHVGGLGSFDAADLADHAPGEIIVKFKGDDKPFHVVRLPAGKSVAQAAQEYGARADVEFAEPNYIASAYFVPNDTYYSYQWHFDNAEYGGIHTEAAWDISTGLGAVVAVVDTGIAYEDYNAGRGEKYYRAPDFAGTYFVQGYDFVDEDTHANDDNSHGTHVAGTVAQRTNNNTGVAGVAHDAFLMPVKVLNKQGSGTYADVADGIRFAVDNGAHIINLSLGGPSPSQALENAVAYAYNNGVTVIAAAGNNGSSAIGYPAAYDAYVIAVGATRYDETLSYYSNFGPSVDVVAPGGDTSVDQNGDGYADGVLQNTFNPNSKNTRDFGYWFFQGTSMATPHVAGLAALLVSNGNAVTPDDVRSALQETADDLGNTGRDDTYGWGLINAPAALAWTSGPVDNPPVVTLTNPADGSVVSGVVAITADATDDSGVTRVDFYIDATLLGSDTSSPYEWPWDSTSVGDGSYTITATATDTASQTASDSVSVLVDNVNDSPVADAGPDQTVSDSDGDGSEWISLDGSGSSDPDGSIVSYEWYEGLTLLATTTSTSVSLSVGTHTITLVVEDDDGATSSDDMTATVLENQPPVADAGFDQSAFVDETVTFDGSGSTDEGSITVYDWDFGDGAMVSGVTVSHAYSAIGIYTVTLTVTDNGGLTDSDTAQVTVSEPADITLSATGYKVKGLQKADLEWFGAVSSNVDVYRDGSVIATTPNDGLYTDDINNRGNGTYVYQLCEEGTTTCSNESTVTFN